MKFNEKLIQLRRQNGMSQETLGEKLKVTRQTISKWELGESKPDMNKLLAISKLFDISIDELKNESSEEKMKNDIPKTTKEFKDISDHKPRKWLMIILIVIAIVIVVVLLNKIVTNKQNNKSIFEKVYDNISNTIEESNITNTVEEQINEHDIYSFNFHYSNGTKNGITLNNMLDDVITSNKTNKDRLISVKYNDINTTDPTEIKNMKQNFEDFTEYEVSLDYDENGYINLITIEDIEEIINTDTDTNNNVIQNNTNETTSVSEFDLAKHNNKFIIFEGKQMGGSASSMLNSVISNNKTSQDHIVSVDFNGISVTSESDIASIQSQIETFDYYRISLGYDANGFVNKISIQKEA